jgi:phosphoadenosine phosphosulfate reductase
MLIEQTLWGERDKVKIAIERLQNFEPPDGYYLAFSGGKDSVTILRLAEMSGVKFDAHYNITTVDPPELVRFIKTFPQVERHRPEMSMWPLILFKGFPPMRQRRYCCEHLKERGGSGRLVVTGIRWEESTRRKRRHMTETCFQDGTKTYLHPIIDWTTEEIWEFIHRENIPYCSLYDEGRKRLGCVLCPMNNHAKEECERWPKIAAQYLRTFDKLVARGVTPTGKKLTFKTGQELFDWWTDRNRKSQFTSQLVLFE